MENSEKEFHDLIKKHKDVKDIPSTEMLSGIFLHKGTNKTSEL